MLHCSIMSCILSPVDNMLSLSSSDINYLLIDLLVISFIHELTILRMQTDWKSSYSSLLYMYNGVKLQSPNGSR